MVLYVNPTFANSFVLYTIFTRNASALRKFARTGRVVRAKKKKQQQQQQRSNPIIYCKSKAYMKHHRNGSFRVFFALANC